jgi:ABC-2 type transport system ATP-binding protein
MEENDIILDVKDLSKTYQTLRKKQGFWGGVQSLYRRDSYAIHAVKPLNFRVKRGEFIGLLGPNGAGKTTTLKMLTGLVPPSSGESIAFGTYNTAQRPYEYLKNIGLVMGQRNQLHPDLPALDSFRLAQAIYQIDNKTFETNLDFYLDEFGSRDKLLVPVRKLSLGERMKMELILSILHEPKLLFLDEPTIGLDFVAAKQIRKFLKGINKEKQITIVLTSHYVKDIQELCRRVVVINQGSCVFDGELEKMDVRLHGQRVIHLFLRQQLIKDTIIEKLKMEQNLKDNVEIIGDDEAMPTMRLAVNKDLCPRVLEWIFRTIQTPDIEDIKIFDRPLEDIFSEIYQGSQN